MATWIAHMRIAEHFMNKESKLNLPYFLVGNIGPDCGVPNEDWSKFTPDKNISHWIINKENEIDTEGFKCKYLKNPTDPKYAFYLGYYFHLLTDLEWKKFYKRKKEEPIYAIGLEKDKNFIWTIKKDWYGQDHVFLQNHPDFVFYTIFAKIKEFENVFFDFYPDNAFIRQIRYITDFYLSSKEDPNRKFPFLSSTEMNDFVEKTIQVIEDKYSELLRFHEFEIANTENV